MLQYGPLVLQFNEHQDFVAFRVLRSKGGVQLAPNGFNPTSEMVTGDYVRVPNVSGLLQFTILDMCLIEVYSLI